MFHSVPDLTAGIENYLASYDEDATPFTWTASVADILEKPARARAAITNQQPNLSTQI